MRKRLIVFFLLTFCIGATLPGNNGGNGIKGKKEKTKKTKIPSYSSKVILERINDLEATFELRLNKDISKVISSYLVRGRRGTEIIIGRSTIYFPVYEKYLAEAGVPDELKYLSVIESALDPKAKSKVGAAGLWQFMPETGRNYGLIIDDYRDERYDIYKSSKAAAEYLADLHRRFKDWTLVIAAYNCGPGRVKKAIREAQSLDFWKLKKYLPEETQHYVQKFIAVNYVMNYYLFHDIHPEYPDYDQQMMQLITIKERTTFKRLSEESGISIEKIQQLNPAYKKGILPATRSGNKLVMPVLGISPYFTDIKYSSALSDF